MWCRTKWMGIVEIVCVLLTHDIIFLKYNNLSSWEIYWVENEIVYKNHKAHKNTIQYNVRSSFNIQP